MLIRKVIHMAARDPVLKLSDKTVALIGNFGSMIQMTMTVLTEQGANVALIGRESAEARRVIENLNDQRELYSHYGRATHVISSMADDSAIQDAVLRAVESFNRLDCLINTSLCEGASPNAAIQTVKHSLKFLTSRPKGRIITLLFESDLWQKLESRPDQAEIQCLQEQILSLSDEFKEKQLTCNFVNLGLTEEYLLRKYPKAPSIRMAFETFLKEGRQCRLLEPIDIANCAMFLASPLSQGLNKQTFKVN